MKGLMLSALLATGVAFAHDEGHGPKLSDTGKYGGLVSAVVKKADAAKGAHADLVYKAELSRADGSVRVYIYDKDMKPVDLAAFEPKASAEMAAKIKGKWKSSTFALERQGNAFHGKMPKVEGKPFNIDVTLKSSGTELLSAFDNLD